MRRQPVPVLEPEFPLTPRRSVEVMNLVRRIWSTPTFSFEKYDLCRCSSRPRCSFSPSEQRACTARSRTLQTRPGKSYSSSTCSLSPFLTHPFSARPESLPRRKARRMSLPCTACEAHDRPTARSAPSRSRSRWRYIERPRNAMKLIKATSLTRTAAILGST